MVLDGVLQVYGLSKEPVKRHQFIHARPEGLPRVSSMKERRKSGATHSFRLTQEASNIVDNLNHPRSLGGKSRLISDAIVFYFQESTQLTLKEAIEDIEHLEEMLRAKNPEKTSSHPAWWRRFWPF